MGDEARHTRQGNNNPWCQDNAMNWLDWQAVEEEQEVLDFVRRLHRFTTTLDLLNDNRFWTATSPARPGDITWHGTKLGKPDWTADSRSLAYTLGRPGDNQILHVMLNASAKPLVFQLPANRPHWRWGRIIDTAAASPIDLILPGKECPVLAGSVKVESKAVVVVVEMNAKS
jgi:glycogen operon protein